MPLEWTSIPQIATAIESAVTSQAQAFVDIENARSRGLLSDDQESVDAYWKGLNEGMTKSVTGSPDADTTLTRMVPAGLNDIEADTVEVSVAKARPREILVPQIREKDTTSIQIIKDNGQKVLPSYTKFYVQNLQRGSGEKVQIMETFEDPNYYFYGSRPRIYELSGILRNDQVFNWAKQFEFIWEAMLKGTRLSEMKAKAYLNTDEVMWVGYPTQVSYRVSADQDNALAFSMTFLLVRDVISGPFDDDVVANAAKFTEDTEGIGSVKSRISEMSSLRKVSSDELAYFEFPTV
ncbi:MAG: hypothetical protein SVK08_00125 [Halobacteriota archaeon]|nr:hypothetical protein [Halobacteriota archaeon]